MRYVTDGDSVENLQQLHVWLMLNLGENCASSGLLSSEEWYFRFGFSTLEDGTNILSRNFCKKLPLLAA
jgi:hypothetical protein